MRKSYLALKMVTSSISPTKSCTSCISLQHSWLTPSDHMLRKAVEWSYQRWKISSHAKCDLWSTLRIHVAFCHPAVGRQAPRWLEAVVGNYWKKNQWWTTLIDLYQVKLLKIPYVFIQLLDFLFYLLYFVIRLRPNILQLFHMRCGFVKQDSFAHLSRE